MYLAHFLSDKVFKGTVVNPTLNYLERPFNTIDFVFCNLSL